MSLIWRRRVNDSTSNFDLMLMNPDELDITRLSQLLESITEEKHRGLTLSGRAVAEFRRFFEHPTTPLKGYAYVLLSNWFTTASGDRNSPVASRCEALWDELFACRPSERLSSPKAGENHIMKPSEFESFWSRLSRAQRNDPMRSGEPPISNSPVASASSDLTLKARETGPLAGIGEAVQVGAESDSSQVSATVVTKDGMPIQLSGSPSAMASFLQH